VANACDPIFVLAPLYPRPFTNPRGCQCCGAGAACAVVQFGPAVLNAFFFGCALCASTLIQQAGFRAALMRLYGN
jgi:hypothetical protein